MAFKNVSEKEKHGWNIRNGFQKCLKKEKHGRNIRNGSQKCLLKRKTWLEKINMAQIMREKHVSYIRERRVHSP